MLETKQNKQKITFDGSGGGKVVFFFLMQRATYYRIRITNLRNI